VKVAYRLFVGSAVFFGLTFALYWFTSYEPAGGTLLALGLPATLMIGVYLFRQQQRFGLGPEDSKSAGPGEGLGEVVLVPAPSVWPAAVAGGAGLMAMGLVFGLWLFVPGALVLAISVAGQALSGRNYS